MLPPLVIYIGGIGVYLMMVKAFLLVGLGGAAGSMARYGTALLVGKPGDTGFPLATFIINIVGSLLIGYLFGLAGRNQWLQQTGMLLLASGFCGGFTTFSTFALENVSLMQKGASIMAIVYIGLSLVLGLLLCRVGMWMAGA